MSSDSTPAPDSTVPDNSSASACDATATATAPQPVEAKPDTTPVSAEPATGAAPPVDCNTAVASPAVAVDASAIATPADDAAERPKFRLNPTVEPHQDKAVPATSVTAQEVEKQLTEEAGAAQNGDPLFAKPGKHVEPIEIPNKRDVSLDDEMEKEIAAAMASGELPNAVVDPASATSSPAELASSNGIPTTEEELEPGTRLKGTVQSVSEEDVILDVGFRSSGCVQTKQFEGKLPEVGAKLNVVVDRYAVAEGLILCSLSKATRTVSGWDEVQVDQIVDCMVTKVNKGGLEVAISSLRGFLPAGQVDFGFISNLETYVGQKLRVKITEVNPGKKNLVVSRRAFLEIERHEKRDEMWKTIAVGQTFSGTVKTIKDYGAFVDLGGLDGLLHVGEISWQRINHPSDVLKEGQQVDVQVVGIDREKNKISLGMRQLSKNPWGDIESRYPVNSEVEGKVTRTTDFGAFVLLEEGIEGLIHISELEYRRVHRVTDVVKEGQDVRAKVLSIDLPKRRIALSLKALQAKPEMAVKKEDADLAPGGNQPYERKHKGPLKGGTTGSNSGSGMFG
jgi:predicted RNA-binding protein with RPS1 domain